MRGVLAMLHLATVRSRCSADELLDDSLFEFTFRSATQGTVQELRALLRKGARPNSSGGDALSTSLHNVAINNRADLLRVLLDAGASASKRSFDGQTPLHWACRGRSLACTQALLDAGADPAAQDSLGRTPLLVAVEVGAVPCVKWLIPVTPQWALAWEGWSTLSPRSSVASRVANDRGRSADDDVRTVNDLARASGCAETQEMIRRETRFPFRRALAVMIWASERKGADDRTADSTCMACRSALGDGSGGERCRDCADSVRRVRPRRASTVPDAEEVTERRRLIQALPEGFMGEVMRFI